MLLQVKIGKTLRTDQVSITTRLAGREVKIRSSKQDQPISETQWIILEARGFATQTEAREFGKQLQTNIQIAALCSHLGADAGEDEILGWVNEDFYRSKGLLEPHQRYAPEVHGVLVLPDDDNTLFPRMEVALTVAADPAQFLGALSELAGQTPITESIGALPVRILNLALINPDRLAKIVLAFSVVEALAQGETWSGEQRNLIQKLATEVEDDADGDGERLEVAEVLRRLSRIGLRQGVKRVLCCNDLRHLQDEWDRLYDLRSDLFHGRKQLAKQEVNKLAADAVKLCCCIILTIIKQNGIRLPSIASTHFGNI